MAKRKRSTRSTSRSPKRSSSRSSSGVSPTGSLLALVVIIGVGALTIWKAAYQENPPAILTRFVESPVPHKNGRDVRKPKTELKQTAQTKPREESSKSNILSAPVPRPSIPVGLQPQKSLATQQVQQASLQPTRVVQRSHVSVGSAERANIEMPRGRNLPDLAPAVVYARERLILRQHAWDKSAPVGTVEKGREMRSYSKTGKWHRIAVPTTDMIGWIHEDRLITGKTDLNISNITTGAILGTAKPAHWQAVYPPRPVGAK